MITIIKPKDEELLEGVPIGFYDIMHYFNTALQKNRLPWIPREKPITLDEIKSLWIPSMKDNLTIHASIDGRVIGSVTVFYDKNSTEYEHSKKRKIGDVGSTIDPRYNVVEIGRKLLKALISELKKENKQARWRIAVENPLYKARIFEKLNYFGKEYEAEEYKKSGLSGKVAEYNLP